MKFPEQSLLTPNIGAGRNEKKGVVFHHTAGAYEGAVSWLRNPKSEASAHVVIARDGRRTVLSSDDDITWHAGRSEFRGRSVRNSVNAFMLGVEFALTADEVLAGLPLSTEQIESALEWLEPRWKKYGWTMADMTDHRQVARPLGRKSDLSPANYDVLTRAIAHRFILPAAPPQTEALGPTEHQIVLPRSATKITIILED